MYALNTYTVPNCVYEYERMVLARMGDGGRGWGCDYI